MKCKVCGEDGDGEFCSANCYMQLKTRSRDPMIAKLRKADPRFENVKIQFVLRLLEQYPVNKHAIILQAFIDTANALKIAENKLIELAQRGVKI